MLDPIAPLAMQLMLVGFPAEGTNTQVGLLARQTAMTVLAN